MTITRTIRRHTTALLHDTTRNTRNTTTQRPTTKKTPHVSSQRSVRGWRRRAARAADGRSGQRVTLAGHEAREASPKNQARPHTNNPLRPESDPFNDLLPPGNSGSGKLGVREMSVGRLMMLPWGVRVVLVYHLSTGIVWGGKVVRLPRAVTSGSSPHFSPCFVLVVVIARRLVLETPRSWEGRFYVIMTGQ